MWRHPTGGCATGRASAAHGASCTTGECGGSWPAASSYRGAAESTRVRSARSECNAAHAAKPDNARLSTALLAPERVAPGGLAWLHLHECWL